MTEKAGVYWVIRRVSDGKFLLRLACFKQESAWSDEVQKAHPIMTRMGLTQIINRMRKERPTKFNGEPWPTERNGHLSAEFKPEEFAVEEVELKTTGRTVAF